MTSFQDPQQRFFKLYTYVPPNTLAKNPTLRTFAPFDIDFKTGLTQKLFKRVTITRGERVLSEYFAEYTEATATYTDLVLDVTHTYSRGVVGGVDPKFATLRTSTIRWQLEDDTFSTFTKTVNKAYDSTRVRLAEVQQRRSNSINEILDIVYAQEGEPSTSLISTKVTNWVNSNEILLNGWKTAGTFGPAVAAIPSAVDDSDWGTVLAAATGTPTIEAIFVDYITNI